MKKIILTILVLSILVVSMSAAVFAINAAPNVDGVTPEMPIIGGNSTDGDTPITQDQQQTNDIDDSVASESNEWTVMIIAIVGLTVMTVGIIYMVSKNWDGNKPTEQ